MLRHCLLLSILLFTLTIAACGGDKEIRGPLFLASTPPPEEAEGFTLGSGGEIIFEALDVRFTLIPLRSVRPDDPKLIQSLVADSFIIIDMEIVNMTEGSKVIFNPAMSALQDDKGSYKKPLEFTALYQVAMHKGMERTLNRELKGRFYDTNAVIRAGKRTKRFLIFTPFTKEGEEARLTLQEVYIGNETMRISFPFKLSEID
jgi:hypothetical protein